MSGTALGLLLVSALLHATWNLIAKRVQHDGTAFVWCYMTAAALVWLPVGIFLLIRSPGAWTWWWLAAPAISGFLHVGYAICLQTGYSRADLSVVYPVARGTGPLLTMIVAIVLLAERPGWKAVGGGLLILLGVAVVAGARRHAAGRASTLRGIGYGGLTGCAIAAYTLWDGHSMSALGLAPVPFFALDTAWEAIGTTPFLPGRAAVLRVIRRQWREVLGVAALSPVAYVLVLEAMRTTPITLVAPTRESGIVIGSLLAWLLFKEPSPVRRLTGAAVVLAGIALVA